MSDCKKYSEYSEYSKYPGIFIDLFLKMRMYRKNKRDYNNYFFKLIKVLKDCQGIYAVKYYIEKLHTKLYQEKNIILSNVFSDVFSKVSPIFMFCFNIKGFKELFEKQKISIADIFDEFLTKYKPSDLNKTYSISGLQKIQYDGEIIFPNNLKPIKKISEDEGFSISGGKYKGLDIEKGKYINHDGELELSVDVTEDNKTLIKRWRRNNYLLETIKNLSCFFLLAVNGELELLRKLVDSGGTMPDGIEKNYLIYLTLLFGHADVATYLESDLNFSFKDKDKPSKEYDGVDIFPDKNEIIELYQELAGQNILFFFLNREYIVKIDKGKTSQYGVDAGGGYKMKTRRTSSKKKGNKKILKRSTKNKFRNNSRNNSKTKINKKSRRKKLS